MQPNDTKEILKALRQTRQPQIERARENIKKNQAMMKSIRQQLSAGPQTIPEMAAALQMDSARVLMFVATMKKFGDVVEDVKDGDYFKYALAPEIQSSPVQTNVETSGDH